MKEWLGLLVLSALFPPCFARQLFAPLAATAVDAVVRRLATAKGANSDPCPLCSQPATVFQLRADRVTLDTTRRSHSEWVASQGTCFPCLAAAATSADRGSAPARPAR